MEKYLATEAGIQMMLTVGQAMAGIEDKQEFHKEMKRTIGFVREQVENIKPFIETFKMARSFLWTGVNLCGAFIQELDYNLIKRNLTLIGILRLETISEKFFKFIFFSHSYIFHIQTFW